jgi:formamidopyrimidine-DNA glycosylase
MPELPEVEVVRRRIEPLWVGRRVAKVITTRPSYFFLTPPATLRRRLVGRTFESLERRGKYLVSTLDDDSRFLLHLGMTGQIFAAGVENARLRRRYPASPDDGREPDEHTHVQIQFGDALPAVFFRDVRKFGKVQWLSAGEESERLVKLGVDALEASGTDFFLASRRRKVPVKSLLLDQSVITGAGNIYADEALFRAGVRPTKRAARLTKRECDAVVDALGDILQRSIELGGSTISDYVAPDGSDGEFQNECRVYGRGGEACVECGATIRRIVLSQRSTHYCGRCQT